MLKRNEIPHEKLNIIFSLEYVLIKKKSLSTYAPCIYIRKTSGVFKQGANNIL